MFIALLVFVLFKCDIMVSAEFDVDMNKVKVPDCVNNQTLRDLDEDMTMDQTHMKNKDDQAAIAYCDAERRVKEKVKALSVNSTLRVK